MTLSIALFLGFLQGLTEFLPISSSGHLVVAEAWLELDVKSTLFFDIILHVATLIAISAFYRERITRLLFAALHWFSNNRAPKNHYDRQMIIGIFITTFVTGVIVKGFGIDDLHDLFRENPWMVGITFAITGFLLLSTRFRSISCENAASFPIHFIAFAVIVGIAQSIAVLPGISRSGTTIAVALLLGASKKDALEYSFMIAIPAILAATLLELGDGIQTISILPTTLGFAVSLISSYVFLWLLTWITEKGNFHQFAYYTIPLGIVVFFAF